jgi:molybdopterin molybdotransferase
MISADKALRHVVENVATLGVERVPLLEALGRVLAEEIRAPRDVPGFDNSAMDGYAVRSADVASACEARPVRLTVIETVAAGATPSRRLEPGHAVRTMTGAPIAPGADAVIPVERTRGDDAVVEVLARVEPGAHIRLRGEDLRAGDTVITPGRRLAPADLGVLASLNRSMTEVYRQVCVAIVATGDELVDIDQIPSGAQVVNSGAWALAGAVVEAGGRPVLLRIARDRPADIRERLAEAMRFDAVLSTGGVSVGQFDHVKHVLDDLGMRTLFHGVAQKPGRPLKFGLIDGRPVFGLPGNPVSMLVCFYLYVRPAMRMMAGHRDLGLPRVRVRCAVDIKVASNLTEFIRVRLKRRDGELYATPTGSQGSGILRSVALADALLIGPARDDLLRAGSEADALVLDPYGVTADTEAFFEERRFQSN